LDRTRTDADAGAGQGRAAHRSSEGAAARCHRRAARRKTVPYVAAAPLGGAELALATFFEVVCAIAEGDASAAWSVSQSSGCAMSAYLEFSTAREIFGDARAVLSWAFRQWSGSGHTAGALSFNGTSSWVTVAAAPTLDLSGGMTLEGWVYPTALGGWRAVTIKEDSWNVVGLRGTGSDTYSVTDLFVPAAHAIVARASGRDLPPAADLEPEAEPERREQGTLYRFSPTSVYQSGFAAVALGIARATQNAFVALASQKTPSGGATLLRDNPVVQLRVAQSEARLESARAWVLQILREMWEHCAATGKVSFEHRIRLRLAATYAIQEGREVVETALHRRGRDGDLRGQSSNGGCATCTPRLAADPVQPDALPERGAALSDSSRTRDLSSYSA
jgi:alkylation response protein AidB-like acyl-CoA dehydrogenase